MIQVEPQKIVATLEEILAWCRSKSRVQVRGEGGERPFRARLSEALLEKILLWPPGALLAGERFDVSLLGADEQPVVTIETKEPGHVTSDTEYKAFLNRLKRYATLRYAYLTNGEKWERFDLSMPLPHGQEISLDDFEEEGSDTTTGLFPDVSGGEKLGRRYLLVLHRATLEDVSTFFDPLNAANYHDLSRALPPGLFRHTLSKNRPEILEDFGAGLRDLIGDFCELLTEYFHRFRSGELGNEAQSVSSSAFQLWCERSYVVSPTVVARAMEAASEKRGASAKDLSVVLIKDLGFRTEVSESVAETFFAENRKKRPSAEVLGNLLWPLYGEAIERYATQTAHVSVARLLLYRIGEDKGIFERKVSREPLQSLLARANDGSNFVAPRHSPVLAEVEDIRKEMADFAPSVYEAGEFDWWRVVHPELLTDLQRQRVMVSEEQLALNYTRLLRRLDLYELTQLDLDIWRDVYQHYLPEDERQSLGGFYTPQELVDLTLDYAGYRADAPRLCERSLIDLASGSGAFVVSALTRLLEHLSDPSLPCHKHLHHQDLSDWERGEQVLSIVVRNIHAIDLHPFAAFLTYVNFLFAVLPLYATVQKQRKAMRLAVSIFSANSLLTPGENGGQRELELAANSRIQLGRHAQERYRELGGKKFDYVVGNPPWGGILKGRIAPIFDENYKRQLAAEYRDTYAGKLDIYGLFYDRGLQFLRSGGTLALITQGSFIDKEWAGSHTEFTKDGRIEIMGLRRKLAEQASLRFLIDLNPFGKLFFGAMNIPCIAVFERRPAREGETAAILLSSKKSWSLGMKKTERRREAIDTVRRCLELVKRLGEPLKQDFVTAFAFPLQRIRAFNGGRWLLASKEFKIRSNPDWPQLSSLVESFQGVTVGGDGGLSIFLMTDEEAKQRKLEKELLHRIIKGQQTSAWHLEWEGKVILYPYVSEKRDKWASAFACNHPPVLDALDFDHYADKFEQDWVRKYGKHPASLKRLLEHRRDALELIKYPRSAEYLFQFYEQLSSRIFEKKNILDCGKQWYEFHRPREAGVVFGHPKIISPRLTPHVRFALDEDGMGIQDSCICLAVSENTKGAFNDFRGRLSKLMGKELKVTAVLKYFLAFLNSEYAQELLTIGHRPRPGDVFQISDEFIHELSIPVPKNKKDLVQILDAVEVCLVARSDKAKLAAEDRLNPRVSSLYSGK